jgi:hypothetical protein
MRVDGSDSFKSYSPCVLHVPPITPCLFDNRNNICWSLQIMKLLSFWDITPCSPLSVNRNFGETYRLYLQGQATCFHAVFLLNLFFRPWRWRRYVPPKRRLTLNRLHGVIAQKMVLFIIIAVRASNPTYEAPQYAILINLMYLLS